MCDITMTNLTKRILKLFLDHPANEFYSAEIARVLGRDTGALRPLLYKLEDKGWLLSEVASSEKSKSGKGKLRIYTITQLGKSEGRKAISCEIEFWCGTVSLEALLLKKD